MKRSTLSFLLSTTLFISGNSYTSETKCPPAELIKNTHFTNIVVWEALYADTFSYNGQNWNVWMSGDDIMKILDDAYYHGHNVDKAFNKSQAYFDAIVSYENNTPTPERPYDDKTVICKYVWNHNIRISAYNPPRIIG